MKSSFLPLHVIVFSASFVFGAPAAKAHDLWVNAMSAYTDGHDDSSALRTVVVTSAGWGHTPMPLAEFLPGARISAYQVIAPDGTSIALPFDAEANADVAYEPEDAGGVRLQAGDALMRRLDLDADAVVGAWRVHLANPARVWTTWIDADGQRHSGARFADEIEGAEQIVSSAVSVRDATAWWRHGDWSAPEPAGAALEMMPLTDPTLLTAGDTLDVQLFWNGAPLEAGPLALFTAFGETGAEAEIAETGMGQASFSLPASGVWVLRGVVDVPVAEAGADYAAYEGRLDTIRFITTLAMKLRQ